MSKFGWAFIGCGDIANTTAKEVVKSDTCFVASALSRSLEKAKAFTKRYGGNPYTDFEEMINDPNVDGVYIALPHDMHAEYMEKCIKHHKPVLCEKPFTINAKEAEYVLNLAKKEGVYVTEAMWTWHNQVALKVKEWINKKMVGEIKEVNLAFAYPITISGKDRLTNPARAGGALLDIGIYGIRYSLELFGMPKEVKSVGRLNDGIDLGENVDLIYDNFVVHCVFAMDKLIGGKLVIEGSEGKIIVPPAFHASKSARLTGKNKDKIKVNDLLYERQFSNVANEIKEGLKESKIITNENVINCLEIMDECRRQMELIYPNEDINMYNM